MPMSILQILGFILFTILLGKCLVQLPAKWRRVQAKENGATADIGFTLLACAFCLWAIVSIFSFPH